MLRKVFATLYPENSLDTDLRYKPIVEFLKNKLKDKPKILEVGSGPRGITRYLNYPITGVDKVFNKPSRLVKQVKVKDIKLPFKTNSFDYVISVDMLEHLPDNKRGESLREMIRVAKKGLVLAVPCGLKAEAQDKDLFDYYFKNHNEEEKVLKEHLKFGLPKIEEINKLIENSGKEVTTKIIPNVNLAFRTFYMKSFFRLIPYSGKYFGCFYP